MIYTRTCHYWEYCINWQLMGVSMVSHACMDGWDMGGPDDTVLMYNHGCMFTCACLGYACNDLFVPAGELVGGYINETDSLIPFRVTPSNKTVIPQGMWGCA